MSRMAEDRQLYKDAFEAGRRSVLSGQQGVLVPRDLAQGLLQCAEEATWMGGVYHIHSATMVTELRALLSGPVVEEPFKPKDQLLADTFIAEVDAEDGF